jgi:allantoicase
MTEKNNYIEPSIFAGCIDLAQEKIGGKALIASDEFFAEKENLLKPGRGIFIADKFTDRGKWMDGWETRRKRVAGYDWCIVKLGVAGIIKGVDIDTNHFLGNNPAYASIDAIKLENDLSLEALANNNNWTEVLPKSLLKPGSQNIFAVANAGNERWTHIRLNIYPDGGVARLRVFGDVVPDWSRYNPNTSIDLAAIENGAYVIAASDMFFGNKDNLIMPGRAINMGDGWETRRRRGPGNDWAIVKLGHAGILEKIEIDTNHFKGNYPDTCWLEACYADKGNIDNLNHTEFTWTEILIKTKLQASHQHYFDKEILSSGPWTHIKINIAPDGGISRLRVHGKLANLAKETHSKNTAVAGKI